MLAFTDLEVFLPAAAPDIDGGTVNPYTSLWTGVPPGDGPQNFHLILLNDGRAGLKCWRPSRGHYPGESPGLPNS